MGRFARPEELARFEGLVYFSLGGSNGIPVLLVIKGEFRYRAPGIYLNH